MLDKESIGLITLIVSPFAAYIFFLHRQFSREREQHSAEREKRNLEWQTIARESNQSQRENTNVLSSLKTLLEATRRK